MKRIALMITACAIAIGMCSCQKDTLDIGNSGEKIEKGTYIIKVASGADSRVSVDGASVIWSENDFIFVAETGLNNAFLIPERFNIVPESISEDGKEAEFVGKTALLNGKTYMAFHSVNTYKGAGNVMASVLLGQRQKSGFSHINELFFMNTDLFTVEDSKMPFVVFKPQSSVIEFNIKLSSEVSTEHKVAKVVFKTPHVNGLASRVIYYQNSVDYDAVNFTELYVETETALSSGEGFVAKMLVAPTGETGSGNFQIEVYDTEGKVATATRPYKDLSAGKLYKLNLTLTEFVAPEAVELSQRDVLMKFYTLTNGPGWKMNDNWGSEEPLNKWKGVTVDAEGNVTGITLANYYLYGTLPEELGELTKLQTLNLSNNKLSGSIPESICQLTELTNITMNRNNLFGPIPANIGNLVALKTLDLFSNNLSGDFPHSIGNLTALNVLRIHTNQITGTLPANIGNLNQVTYMQLYNNKMTGAIPASINNITTMNTLSLYNNEFSGEMPDISGLVNLQYLQLDNNKISGVIPANIGNLTKLKEIFLNDNNLTGTIPTSIGNIVGLTKLLLQNNQLTGGIPSELGNFGASTFKYLDLSGNQLTGEIPESLNKYRSMDNIMLANNQLTGSIPAFFQLNSNIKILHLSGNKFSGTIPEEYGKFGIYLSQLWLHDNNLTGSLPALTTPCTALGSDQDAIGFNCSGNQLTGEIPAAYKAHKHYSNWKLNPQQEGFGLTEAE